jgi:UDP-N-acetyl-D-galactosamine dehydrogenase
MSKIFPCVVGLGYVGLPVFIALKKKFEVVGYDINNQRVNSLNSKIDTNNEFNKNQLNLLNKSIVTSDDKKLERCNFYIVAVPTPVNKNNKPDLKHVKLAFKTISKYIKKNDIIFLESTVFPGTTEDICNKILINKVNVKFHLGYSSERINPGDKIHNIKNISKVVAIKSTDDIILKIKKIYSCISKKIIFSKKIKEAELSKLIENTQRDLNIALMNEIMILCHKTRINYNEVIKLAKTKWNFLKFNPGLVGGHCLPVDPYYLSYFAKKYNFTTKVTLAGRKINNQMEKFIFSKIYKRILKIRNYTNKKIVIAGLTYKPDVADLRNSIAMKILDRFKRKKLNISAFDPTIDHKLANELNIERNFDLLKNKDIFIFLVRHQKFENIYNYLIKKRKVIIDPFLQ